MQARLQRTPPTYPWFRRSVVTTLVGLLAALVLVVPASAGVSWCRADPVVELNGKRVQLWVAIPQQHAAKVSGPIEVEINVPSSVSRKVVLLDVGFNGFGEKVTFTTNNGTLLPGGAFYISVVVRVPMNGVYRSVPVQVEVVNPDGSTAYYHGSQWATTGTFVVK